MGPRPIRRGTCLHADTRATSSLQLVCSTADKPYRASGTRHRTRAPSPLDRRRSLRGRAVRSIVRAVRCVFMVLANSFRPSQKDAWDGVADVWACPSARELRNLTYHDRTIHTERQRAQAHHERTTGAYTHSVERSPPHSCATRGHALCQTPLMHANVRVCRSPHWVSPESASYPARASHARTSSRLRRHLAQVCAACPLHAQGARQSPPVRQDARRTVKFPTEAGYRPRPTGASRWTPWRAPAHP